jgi:drug/metabolite transporter (DMT)-like permease
VWGTTYLGIRIALDTIPPFLMASGRWSGAGLILLVILMLRGENIPGPRKWPSLAVQGLLMTAGNGGASGQSRRFRAA